MWHEIDGNRWDAEIYTKEQAEALARTLANCTDCANCTGCTDCANCTGCTDCAGCTDCTNCTYCTDCANCTGCTDCARCTGIPSGAKYACMIGLYRYVCSPRIHSDGTQWIQMGCYLRTRKEWESDPHNNPSEFPECTPQLARRDFALSIAYQWLDEVSNG